MATTSRNSRTERTVVRTSEAPRLRPVARVREIWPYREILANLVRKDLKVKYAQSVLGAVWSALNPLMYLLVFWFVFKYVLKNPTPHYAVYLLSGLIAWNFFSGSLALAARSVVDNSSLVKKVYFPKEILPLAAVGTSFVDYLLQIAVLIVFMVVARYGSIGWNTLLILLAVPALVVFTTAVSMWVAATNVSYRDTQHLINLVLLAWFWLTPIVYSSGMLQEILSRSRHQLLGLNLWYVYFANIMGDVVMGFQRIFYGTVTVVASSPPPPHLQSVGADMSVGQMALLLTGALIVSFGLLLYCWKVFFDRSGDFAEDL
jgi:ABC-2 type transport system permease protein